MPEKIEIDGVVKEYYTAEDLEQKVGETKTEYETRIKDLEQEVNPNFKAMREASKAKDEEIARLRAKLPKEDQEEQQKIDVDALKSSISSQIKNEMINDIVEDSLSQFDDNSREVVKKYFDKLIVGEQVTAKNVHQFIAEAARVALPDSPKFNPLTVGTGGAPIQGEKNTDFSETEAGKDIAKRMGLTQ